MFFQITARICGRTTLLSIVWLVTLFYIVPGVVKTEWRSGDNIQKELVREKKEDHGTAQLHITVDLGEDLTRGCQRVNYTSQMLIKKRSKGALYLKTLHQARREGGGKITQHRW